MFGRSKKPKEPEIDEKEERIKELEKEVANNKEQIAELVATVHEYDKKHAKMNCRMVIREDAAEDMHDTIYVIKDILGKVDFEIVNDINEKLDILRRERKERREKEREARKRLRRQQR